jgi:integrase
MGSQLLTDVLIRKLRPEEGRQFEVFDSRVPGLAVRISPKGTKTFTLLYRAGRRARRMTVGRYPLLSLAEARARAERALREVSEGRDPAAAKQAARNRYDDQLFTAVADEFVEKHAKRKTRTWRETERILKREFAGSWKHRQIQDISKQDLNRVLDGIVARNAPIAANGALAAVRKLFNWAIERGYVSTSPCAGTQRPSKAVSRNRVLSHAELAAVWRAACDTPYPFGPVVQLLILTAQRRAEVVGMRWCELDLKQRLWTLPPARTKANREHAVPLSELAVQIIISVPRLHDDLVFPARGKDTTASGFSKWKQALDKKSKVTGWTLHDVRRTAATRMAELGVRPHVIEHVLNHQMPGVAGVYNRFEYLPEMREALTKWNSAINTIAART